MASPNIPDNEGRRYVKIVPRPPPSFDLGRVASSYNSPYNRSFQPEALESAVKHAARSQSVGEQQRNPSREDFGEASNAHMAGYYGTTPPSFEQSTHESPSLSKSAAEFQASSARQRGLSREHSEAPEPLEDIIDELDDYSDADSDYREFQASLAKKRNEIENFKASRSSPPTDLGARQPHGRYKSRGEPRGRGGFRGARGPRRAAEPTGDIKLRLAKASEAFIEGDYEEARDVVTEIIRINAETYEAWTILATIFQELGETDHYITSLMGAAHLRPKVVEVWLNCARACLEDTGRYRKHYLKSAKFCYSSAIRANPKSFEARLGKARLLMEQNKPAIAITDYKTALRYRPHNLEAIRELCAAYFDTKQFDHAKNLYQDTFAHFKTSPGDHSEDVLTWSDVDSYIAIYEHLGQYDSAIKELKHVSRWLLGRESEEFWDHITKDDREWDAGVARRIEVAGFDVDHFPQSTYGEGLPLELRTRLGLCRLSLGQLEEATGHLDWLDPLDESGEGKVFLYDFLYRQVANKLADAGYHQQALKFYQPLKQIPQESNGDLYIQMGKCFLADSLSLQAEECFQTAIQVEEDNIEARMQLANMYEGLNEDQQAFIFINEIAAIRIRQLIAPKEPRKPLRTLKAAENHEMDAPPLVQSKESAERETSKVSNGEAFMPVRGPKSYKRRRLADPEERLKEETAKAEQLQNQYYILRREHKGMRREDPQSTRAWIAAARDLLDDFRSVKNFYPWDKHMRFLGYSSDNRLQAETSLDGDVLAMQQRLSDHLGADIASKASAPKVEIPSDYRGISFSSWLDIFLDYALCLARLGNMQESYEICEAAKDSVIYYHNREDMFLIHVCWCTCAMLACDEETCVLVARFFMKDYQFTTDSYRMFTAVTRLVQSPVSWYSSGPSQKYILRQIKAMDYALVDKESQKKFFTERGSYSAQNENGQLIINDDLDIALLMLYGHILYTGTSYAYALNYFLRAHTLDPENSMINLNVGLAYVHYALKRQAENRQHLILQGLTFLFSYYDSRKTSTHIEERQEAHYNIARIYHLLGLANLAIPYYGKVFKEIEGGNKSTREDLVIDAAYNLQSIYAMSGNQELASAITRRWLVI